MSSSTIINNIDNNTNIIEFDFEYENEIEKHIELNKITKMLYGVELHKIIFLNGDMSDLRYENLKFK